MNVNSVDLIKMRDESRERGYEAGKKDGYDEAVKQFSKVIENAYNRAIQDLKDVEDYGAPLEVVEYPSQTYEAGYANAIKNIASFLNIGLPSKEEIYAAIEKEENDLEELYENCLGE